MQKVMTIGQGRSRQTGTTEIRTRTNVERSTYLKLRTRFARSIRIIWVRQAAEIKCSDILEVNPFILLGIFMSAMNIS